MSKILFLSETWTPRNRHGRRGARISRGPRRMRKKGKRMIHWTGGIYLARVHDTGIHGTMFIEMNHAVTAVHARDKEPPLVGGGG